jgi:S-DNA-T family DNA segregation ATPase FtsK/SpoIIIE
MAVTKKTVRTGWQEFWGIILIAFSLLVLLSLLSYVPEDLPVFRQPPNNPARNFIGPAGAWLSFSLFVALGLAAYIFPPVLMASGLLLIFKREGLVWPKIAWMAGILLMLCILFQVHVPAWEGLGGRLGLTGGGGEVGYLLADGLLVRFLGTVGSLILVYGLLIALVFVLIEIHPIVLARQLAFLGDAAYRKVDQMITERRDQKAQIEREEREIAKRRKRLEEVMKEQETTRARAPEPKPAIGPAVIISPPRVQPAPAPAAPPIKPEPEKPVVTVPRKDKPKEPVAADTNPVVMSSTPSGYRSPSLDLLDPLPPESARAISGDFQASAAVLKETLSEFGVEVDVTNVERGPVVTRYELLPAPGVRVEKIAQLSNNIALAMKAESIRVQAPIPGKGVVGIEGPNSKTTMVFLREIMESDAWQSGKAALPLALGKDVAGREIVADLAEMPHMLIAGATGSGKTVCMNSILAGLLMARTPDEMRLMLIDPKIVEFTQYNKLPHLVVPVITDAKKVAIGLRWAITEMEKRYRIFAKAGVRNIKAFNSRPIVKQAELFEEGEAGDAEEEERTPDRLPYIVIVVDELADLMLVAQAEIENSIARLAQLSRAVGIHMILATQRPSVNVITGTIKANFPARISFQVAQKVDSRTILDATGADKLLGKGDMLFLPPGSSKLIRAQGTMTSDAELRRVVEFIRQQAEPEYEAEIHQKIEKKGADLPDMEEDDDLLEAAIEVIRQTRRASTSSLQRRLRIGYTRAARLVDILEERGIVGPPRGSDPREILIDLDGEIPQNQMEDEEL